MYEPAVSVVIPAYNAGRFLEETLNSVREQSFTEYEVIVIDDGSTDNTAEIAKSFEGVRYYFQLNNGPASARNAGLEMAQGEYVIFLDADDLWHRDMLAACVEVLESQPEFSAVHANWVTIDEKGALVSDKSGWQPWRGNIFSRLLVTIALINPAILWRRLCFDEIGGFDETPEMNDDWLNWLRLAYRGHLFECLDQPLVYYRRHDGNLTRTQSYRVIEWRKRALDQICAEVTIDQELKNRAYAQVYWTKTVAALSMDDTQEAARQFHQAVRLDSGLLRSAETYYAIAAGNYGTPSAGALDMNRALENIRTVLDGLNWEADRPVEFGYSKTEISGTAYFYLAQMAYGSGFSLARAARAMLWQAAKTYPRQFSRPERATWAARILIGRKPVQWLRQIGQRIFSPVIFNAWVDGR